MLNVGVATVDVDLGQGLRAPVIEQKAEALPQRTRICNSYLFLVRAVEVQDVGNLDFRSVTDAVGFWPIHFGVVVVELSLSCLAVSLAAASANSLWVAAGVLDVPDAALSVEPETGSFFTRHFS